MRYELILMDADDTLFDFQSANRRAVSRLLDEVGYRAPKRYEEYQVVNHACWEALERGEMNQARLKVERFARFFRERGIRRDPEAAARRFVELLGMQSILLPGAEDVARAIAARLPLVILTNGITEVQKSRMARSPLKEVISGLMISEEAGVSKPDPALFDCALERFGADRRRTLMIGDGLNSDVRGANNAHMDVCWYNPGRLPLPSGLRAEYTVYELKDCVPVALQE